MYGIFAVQFNKTIKENDQKKLQAGFYVIFVCYLLVIIASPFSHQIAQWGNITAIWEQKYTSTENIPEWKNY